MEVFKLVQTSRQIGAFEFLLLSVNKHKNY